MKVRELFKLFNEEYINVANKDNRYGYWWRFFFKSAKSDLSTLPDIEIGGGTGSGDIEEHTHQADEILYRNDGDTSIFNVKQALDDLMYEPGSVSVSVTYGYTEYGNNRSQYRVTGNINRLTSQINTAYLYYSNDIANKLNVKDYIINSASDTSHLSIDLTGQLPMQGNAYLRLEVTTFSGEVIVGSVYVPFRYRSYVGCTSVDYLSQNDPIMYSSIGVTTTFLLKGASNISLTPTVPATKFIFAYPLVMGNCEIKYGNFIMQLPYNDIDIIGPYDTMTYRFYQSEYPLNVSSNYTFTIN